MAADGLNEHIRRSEEAQRFQTELGQRRWEAKFEAKSEIEAQGFKGLLLINGGAGVALGALLQAVISKPEAVDFVPFVLVGILINVIGVAFAAVIFWVRYMQGRYEDKHKKFFRENPWWIWRWYLGAASVLCFLVGLGLVVIGGFIKLKPPVPSIPAVSESLKPPTEAKPPVPAERPKLPVATAPPTPVERPKPPKAAP